ncbi:MAG: hypothetical protein M1834_002681 [Cirrosporium novae-zelandiae]|nr:MAG: hypothetical protein M1834_002681 [Cirrosporium novae-zelandiae]
MYYVREFATGALEPVTIPANDLATMAKTADLVLHPARFLQLRDNLKVKEMLIANRFVVRILGAL